MTRIMMNVITMTMMIYLDVDADCRDHFNDDDVESHFVGRMMMWRS